MPKAKPRDPNQRAKATVDAIIARTEGPELQPGIRIKPGGAYETEIRLNCGPEPVVKITSAGTRSGKKP
jgi:hypothetical protein